MAASVSAPQPGSDEPPPTVRAAQYVRMSTNWRTVSRSAEGLPLMARSTSNRASMRLTASRAIGEMTAVLPRALRWAAWAMSASSKTLRRP